MPLSALHRLTTMIPIDIATLVFVLTAGIAFAIGRVTAPKTVNETTNDVTINVPAEPGTLAALDLDHPAVNAALTLPLAKARVWLRAYELAATETFTDCPEDDADRAVQAAFD